MRKQLLKVLEQIKDRQILVIGDLMLDRYIWGKVNRISQEAPVPVVEVSRMEDRLGGAGNVVRNLRNLGVNVSICAVVGDDKEGQLAKELLTGARVKHSGLFVDSTRPTTLKTRVIAHHQQVVRIDREQCDRSNPEVDKKLANFIDKKLSSSDAILVSDYGKGVVSDNVLKVLETACDDGRLGLKRRPYMVDPHPRNYGRYKRMNVAKPNRGEAEIASGLSISSVPEAFKAAKKLIKLWHADMMVVSLGEDGLVIVDSKEERRLHLETQAQNVFDVSGAGDTITALFTAALAVGADAEVAGVLANIGAGIVISEVGTVAIDPEKLRSRILQLE